VELHIDSLEHEVPLTPDDLRKLARYLDRLAYAAAETPGRRGRSADGFYADIAEFAKQAHRDRHRTGLSVRAAIAAKRNGTDEAANKWRARARKVVHLQETREQAQTT
jgi:hypothetical protein